MSFLLLRHYAPQDVLGLHCTASALQELDGDLLPRLHVQRQLHETMCAPAGNTMIHSLSMLWNCSLLHAVSNLMPPVAQLHCLSKLLKCSPAAMHGGQLEAGYMHWALHTSIEDGSNPDLLRSRSL
jgi:hypothetical protein